MRTDDGYMVYRCLNGDSSAFGFLVDKYRESVYALAYSRLRNFHDAQDVAQEVFVRAYENLHKLRRWDSFASWLYRIALSLCSRWTRSQSRRPDREFIEDQEPGMFEDQSLDSYRKSLMYESLHEALDSLAETHREVLTLHYFGGMTSSEIARFIGVSPAAVRKRLARARSLLKTEMLDTMQEVFEEQELPAGFTLRILEMVKHIRVQPLPRLAELGWGLSIALGIMIAVLGSGSFIKLDRPPDSYMESAAPAATGSTGTGEIPVTFIEQTSEREGDASMLNNKKMTAAAVFTAMVGILSGNALAQTDWTKYDANPVLPKEWDAVYYMDPTVIHEDGVYRMYYAEQVRGSHEAQIFYATSPNGIDWSEHGMILQKSNEGWDDKYVRDPFVLRDDEETDLTKKYKMWYMGSTPTSDHAFGYAYSEDGENWVKWHSNPVVPQEPVPGFIWPHMGSVILDNGIYRMYYAAWSEETNFAIFTCVSDDGADWVNHERINWIGDGAESEWDSHRVTAPFVIEQNGNYYMWYAGTDGSEGHFGYATSTNGIDWEKHPDNPILAKGSTGDWDDVGIGEPAVVWRNGTYEMWFQGVTFELPGGFGYDVRQIGYATAPMGDVYIDIKPGSYPNSVNLGSNGVVPVAILSFGDFDATTVDPDSVSLSGAGVAVRGKGNKLLAHTEDVNGDGLTDLVVQVETENLDPGAFQDGYAVLTGNTQDEQQIEGWDEITIVPVDGDAAPADSTGSEAFAAFPQPANPELWIPYRLAQDVDVTITIRNISGRMIRTLNLGHQPSGLYVSRDKAAYWNGRNEAGEQVSSGVYFYTIQAGEFTATRKMVIGL